MMTFDTEGLVQSEAETKTISVLFNSYGYLISNSGCASVLGLFAYQVSFANSQTNSCYTFRYMILT